MTVMIRAIASAAVVALSVTATAVPAQELQPPGSLYRDGQPSVLRPQGDVVREAPPPAPAMAFTPAYERAGRPKIAVFFNRTVAAEPESWVALSRSVVERDVVREGAAPLVVAREDRRGRTTTVEAPPGRETSRVEARHEINAGAAGARDVGLSDIDQERVRAAFEATLLTEKVRLLDRAMTIRLQSRMGDAGDLQLLEIDALKGHADLVLAAYGIRDLDSPLGIAWRLTVMSVKDGSILYSDLVRGTALRSPPARPWTAVPGGFAEASATDASPDEIGRRLAGAVLGRLGSTL